MAMLFPDKCPEPCDHTPAEHRAFDSGYRAGQQGQETNPYSRETARMRLRWEAWDWGNAYGKHDPEAKPAGGTDPLAALPQEAPLCNTSGICTAFDGDSGYSNCQYCGKELYEKDGYWWTWDAVSLANPLPQHGIPGR